MAKTSAAKADAKKADGVNKSAEIRKLASAMKARGEKPRPSVVVTELAKRGVEVAPAQVSGVLKRMGFRPLRRRKKGAKGAKAAGAAPAKRTAKSAAISLEDLLAAKKVVGALGGTDKAIAALQALKQFEK
jgi:hypothetical protein